MNYLYVDIRKEFLFSTRSFILFYFILFYCYQAKKKLSRMLFLAKLDEGEGGNNNADEESDDDEVEDDSVRTDSTILIFIFI